MNGRVCFFLLKTTPRNLNLSDLEFPVQEKTLYKIGKFTFFVVLFLKSFFFQTFLSNTNIFQTDLSDPNRYLHSGSK